MDDTDAKVKGEVLGFRRWNVQGYRPAGASRVSGYRLTSVGLGRSEWETVMAAKCHRNKKHHAPEEWCHCGLYAYHKLTDVRRREAYFGGDQLSIVGAVAGWGALEVHEHGWRAANARILALAIEPQLVNERNRRIGMQLAFHYGVPLVDIAELETVAREWASPLDASEIPEFDWLTRATHPWRQMAHAAVHGTTEEKVLLGAFGAAMALYAGAVGVAVHEGRKRRQQAEQEAQQREPQPDEEAGDEDAPSASPVGDDEPGAFTR